MGLTLVHPLFVWKRVIELKLLFLSQFLTYLVPKPKQRDICHVDLTDTDGFRLKCWCDTAAFVPQERSVYTATALIIRPIKNPEHKGPIVHLDVKVLNAILGKALLKEAPFPTHSSLL